MADMNKIYEYLNECGTFYFATIKDGAPEMRPLGFKMVVDGQLYFGIGTHKAVFAQLTANPKVSICATKPDGKCWMRMSGTAVIDDDPALVDKAFEAAPYLKPMYEENGWQMGILHLEDGTVSYYENLMAPAGTEQF